MHPFSVSHVGPVGTPFGCVRPAGEGGVGTRRGGGGSNEHVGQCGSPRPVMQGRGAGMVCLWGSVDAWGPWGAFPGE